MLRKLVEVARDPLVIVDRYLNAGTFTLAAAAPDGISRRFLSSDHPAVKQEVAVMSPQVVSLRTILSIS